VDASARAEIYEIIGSALRGGAGVILVSSDFEELARVSSRVLVLREGRITAELQGDEVESWRITQLVLAGPGTEPPTEGSME
jgi:ribose transport system ATP-binding protein